MNKPTRKKILFLITKSNWGGAQRYVFDLATHLDKNQYEVIVALGGGGRLSEELIQKKIRVIHLKSLERDISFVKEIKSIHELYKILRSERPDILHINSSKAGGLGAFLGRVTRVPRIIFTAHGWAFNEGRASWQKTLIKILHWITVLLSHTTIAVSKTTKHQLNLPFAQKKMTVIHNGRTTPSLFSRDFARSFFIGYIPELAPLRDDFWSVTVGELHPIKQHEVTIRALAEVVKKHKNVRHIIIGDGDEREKLERLIFDLDLENNVFLVGHILEASHYLPAFDLFILSSRSEALAYVIIEACIAKLPIIASNVGGIPEIITHGKDGVLYPEGNAHTLAIHYTKLFEDTTYRDDLAKHAGLRATDFSFEKMLVRTISIYEGR